jgi:ABC-2 type transport system ATP-binding protein/lipopolysaccharide transport system ATP-binding protein
MSRNVVEVEGVSKRYVLGEHQGGRRTLKEALSSSMPRLRRLSPSPPHEELWSLRDVSLTVAEGDALGVIGRNGAGKSTLLKILTRITEPTEGVARTRGRVGSLLEVGTGFHPELTGRENVYLNGAILGMPRSDIERSFDEIVDFAGVHRFLDTPVKRYSSGMYLRLAFAVAAHLEADIMAVDEVLAVGDAEFQRKCLGKMASVEQEGRTVLFVSHNLDAITRLCPTSVWLEKGTIEGYGPTQQVVEAYLASGVRHAERRKFDHQADQPVALREVVILGPSGQSTPVLQRSEPFTVEVHFVVREYTPGLDLAVYLQNLKGVRLLDEAWSDDAPDDRGAPGEYVARLTIPPVLNVGDYLVGVWIGSAYVTTLLFVDDALHLRLEGTTRERPDRIMQLGLSWDVRSELAPRAHEAKDRPVVP